MAGFFSKLNVFKKSGTSNDTDPSNQEPEMATEASSHLTCPICLEYFRSPKLLPCGHTLCLKCVADLARRHANTTTASNGRSANNVASFPCPSCRKRVVVPPGGVSAFPNNFYISVADMERSRLASSTQCRTHPEHLLRFLCMECDEFICSVCKLTQHTSHRTKDLMLTEDGKGDGDEDNRAVTGSDDNVLTEVENLRRELTAALTAAQEEQKAWSANRALLEKQVKARAKQISALTRLAHDAALAELQSLNTSQDNKHKTNIKHLNALIADLDSTQNPRGAKSDEARSRDSTSAAPSVADATDGNVSSDGRREANQSRGEAQPKDDSQNKDVKDSGPVNIHADNAVDSQASQTNSETASAARTGNKTSLDMPSGSDEAPSAESKRSFEEILQDARNAISEQSNTVSHCTLLCQSYSVRPDVIAKYIGLPRILSVPKMAPVVSLKRAFRSGADDNSEVHTICVVKETSKVWLCQRLSDRENNDYRKAIFTLAGAKLNLQDDTAPARVTWKMISGSMFIAQALYSKGDSPFRLSRLLPPKASMSRITALQAKKTDKGAVQCVDVNLLDIHAKDCVGFDVSPDGQLFAVVAASDSAGPDTPLQHQRKVLLFTHDTPKAVVAYSPPDSESFYPTDVCFYVIGGVTVLLVADWLGDSVHVLHVTEERLSFVRHLAADCTELVKPGALSTDWTGRLWVGCRGGTVLCGSPLGPD